MGMSMCSACGGESSDEPAIVDRFQVPSEFHEKHGEIGQRGDDKAHTLVREACT